MTSKFEAALLAAMARMLNRWGLDAAEVTGWEQYTEYGGRCPTCRYEQIMVRIDYCTAAGDAEDYRYSGDFGELIRSLTDEDEAVEEVTAA